MAVKKRTVVGAVAGVALAISALIKPWEGLRTDAYQDIVGVWTVCYGETLGVQKGQSFTKAECESKLMDRVQRDYYRPLVACVPDFDRKPVQWQGVAISVAYNVGVGAVCKSTAVKLIRANKVKESCEAFTNFNRAGGRVVQGLVNRRAAELKVCLKGVA